MRRAVILLPSGLTIANLFFGIFAIVAAARGDPSRAGLYVVLAGIFDVFDGRVARATNTGTPLGSELDSLVDIVSFGVAPAMIMYFAVLNHEGWDWVFSFAFIACAALRLARFNVEQAGRAKRYFHGLPSPAAGLTLATYYWFSQTSLYNDTNIANLQWHVMLRFVMAGLGALMVSDASYPAVPTVGFRSLREILGTIVVLGTIIGVFFVPKQFFFPACLAYVLYGLGRSVLLGLLGRPTVSNHDAELENDEEDETEIEPLERTGNATLTYSPSETTNVARRRRRRRRPRRDRPGNDNPDEAPPLPET
ncbi:MAG TPA: CDP-diacylglycerol--serine O-phosphatidyltransferase [Gemmatimonadaceae bacterium]|nr:CDP-diacylglycerol--serine O-phosphatidyltransferase [Gemmatimonadaceae bacterium]